MASQVQSHAALIQCSMCSRLFLGTAAYEVSSGRVRSKIVRGQQCRHCGASLDACAVSDVPHAPGSSQPLRYFPTTIMANHSGTMDVYKKVA